MMTSPLHVRRRPLMATPLSTTGILMMLLITKSALANSPFIQQPRDVSVVQGHNAVLECKVEGQESVQWSRNGFAMGEDRELEGFDRYSMVGDPAKGEHRLQIRRTKVEDEGQYRCMVMPSDRYGSGKQSRPANLTVIVPPERPSIINGLSNNNIVSVVLHSPTTLTCRADSGKPAASLTWYLEGNRLTQAVTSEVPRGTRLFDAISTLRFNATLADAGKRVQCKAEVEEMPRPMVTEATLNVQFAPQLEMTWNHTKRQMRQHDTVKFHCESKANPSDLRWRWYLNDILIPSANSDSLVLNLNYTHDNSHLSCQGTNTIGSSRDHATLDVQYGARFYQETHQVGADIDDSVTLHCRVAGNPMPQVLWRKQGEGRVLGTGEVYTIQRVSEEQFGVYTCTATVSGFSQVSRDVWLLKKAPPSLTLTDQQFAVSGETGRLECVGWSVPLPNATGITWYHNGQRVVGGDGRIQTDNLTDGSFTVKSVLDFISVHSKDFGVYNCTISNAKGTVTGAIWMKEEYTFPTIYVIIGSIVLFVISSIAILVCCLYKKYKKEDLGSVLGSYTDTDSEKREKADFETLMGQLRQDYNKDGYRFSGDYDDMPYKEQHSKEINGGYGYLEPYSETEYNYDGDYIHRGDDLNQSDRYDPAYSGTGLSLHSFRGSYDKGSHYDRGDSYDYNTPPSTMTRISSPEHFNAKLATDV